MPTPLTHLAVPIRIALGVLLLAGCNGPTGPLAPDPSAVLSLRTTPPSPTVTGVAHQRVALCHATGNGAYRLIEVSVAAEPAHRVHGDGAAGEPVPGQPGKVFREDCLPITAGPMLVCGYPAGAEGLEGAAKPPGTELVLDSPDTNVPISYDVTMTPAPPDGTQIMEEVYVSGVLSGTLTRTLISGYFAEYSHLVGTVAPFNGTLEIRFVYQDLFCSLFWSVTSTF